MRCMIKEFLVTSISLLMIHTATAQPISASSLTLEQGLSCLDWTENEQSLITNWRWVTGQIYQHQRSPNFRNNFKSNIASKRRPLSMIQTMKISVRTALKQPSIVLETKAIRFNALRPQCMSVLQEQVHRSIVEMTSPQLNKN